MAYTHPYREEDDFNTLIGGPVVKTKPRVDRRYLWGSLIGLAILAFAFSLPNPLSPF